jgi:hypothetical protein
MKGIFKYLTKKILKYFLKDNIFNTLIFVLVVVVSAIKNKKKNFLSFCTILFIRYSYRRNLFLWNLSNLRIPFIKKYFFNKITVLIEVHAPYFANKLHLLEVLVLSRLFSYHLLLIVFVYSHLIIRLIYVVFTCTLFVLSALSGIDYSCFLEVLGSTTLKLAGYLPQFFSLLSFVLSEMFKYHVLSKKKIVFKYLAEDKFFLMLLIYLFLYKWFC